MSMTEQQRQEIEDRIADLETKYWVLDDGDLYIKNGKGSVVASRFYTHTDPAGVVHWNYDSRQVTDKEFKLLSGWQSSREVAVPRAEEA
jgi:hypothetical protein